MPTTFPLPALLRVDAATCAGMGGVLILGAAPVSELTDIPTPLLFWAGVALLPIAAFMLAVSARPAAALVRLVVAGNLAWVAASLAVLVLVGPNALGATFLLAQAAVVSLLAWLEAQSHGGGASSSPV